MGDLRLKAQSELELNNTRLVFVDEFFGTEIRDEDPIASLGRFEARLDPPPKSAAAPPSPLEPDGRSNAQSAAPTISVENGGERPPHENLELKHRTCADAGLDVTWCNDAALMDSLLNDVRLW